MPWQGKAPSKFTTEVLKKVKEQLPFADKRDFDEQRKGLIAPMKQMQIKADAGHVAWDMERFQFLTTQDDFDSIHPSLHRQGVLNNNYGLYEVIPGIYQVRGFDLSNITFVRGKTGWIVFDPLITGEPVRAAWELFQEHVGEGLPVTAVIYSHTHGDHWGGVRGLIKEEDVRSGKVAGNPTNLLPAPQAESGALLVEMMGGADKVIARGVELCSQGKYQLACELVNPLVHAQPQNQPAKDLLADAFEQLGYQQENAGLRNSYLAAAYELRSGIPEGEIVSSSSPDVIRAMSTELFLNFLGIRMDGRKAEGMRFTMNLVTPDNGEKFLVELDNATLTNLPGFVSDKPDLSLTINRSDLEQTMMGAKTLEAQIMDGTAKVEGDVSILGKLAATMVDFDPRFEIMPGTKSRGGAVTKADPYEALTGKSIAE